MLMLGVGEVPQFALSPMIFADHSSMLWLGRSAIGRWRCKANLSCIHEDAKAAGLDLSVVEVGQIYCIISFSSLVMRDCALGNNRGWFLKWFLDVEPWELMTS